MDVFRAFPNAIVRDKYCLLESQRGTLIGNQVTNVGVLDVIVDEGQQGTFYTAPNAEAITADILMYVKPEQLPTNNSNQLVTGYMILDIENDYYYEILDAGLGKNQETGRLEHVELLLRQTEVA